jgi:S1-C subfamily serine protease
MHRYRHAGRATTTLLAVLLTAIASWYVVPELRAQLRQSEVVPRLVQPRGDLASDEKAMIDLFERARASVVFISTSSRVVDYWTRNVSSVPRGTGSGFVWDRQGHVVTNLHVIQGASEATVKLSDGREYPASLVGASAAHDLAVLRIRVPADMPIAVPVGSSSDLKVGQKVFAIGNPFGLDWTLTTGIVSALDRSLPTDKGGVIAHLIQTDAAINPGNSGGPLLDSAGRLIGVNTAIFSPSGASAGVGFAVPVDTVNRVVPQLVAKGRYAPPTLGVQADARLNELLSRQFGVEGVFVLQVVPGSVAARAGLLAAEPRGNAVVAGDVIVAVDGFAVGTPGELRSRLDDHRPGDVVKLRLWRAGRTRDANVTLEAPEDPTDL